MITNLLHKRSCRLQSVLYIINLGIWPDSREIFHCLPWTIHISGAISLQVEDGIQRTRLASLLKSLLEMWNLNHLGWKHSTLSLQLFDWLYSDVIDNKRYLDQRIRVFIIKTWLSPIWFVQYITNMKISTYQMVYFAYSWISMFNLEFDQSSLAILQIDW